MTENNLFEQRKDFFFPVSPSLRGILSVGLVVGLGAFIAGMASGHHERTWGSFLFNLLFFFSLALGGSAFGNMQDIIGALWARPIKRIHETFAAFLPIGSVLLLFFFTCLKLEWFGAQNVFTWIRDPSFLSHFHGKDVWLQPNFMLVRDVIALFVILWLVRWQHLKTTKGDFELINGDRALAKSYAEASRVSMRHWSAPILVIHSLCFSLLAFDLTMSLAPTWFSTLWGGWSFAIMMQTLMATTLLVMFAVRQTPLGSYIGRQQFHDVGKLCFGFTVFYAYLTFAHILTYWYANMPEETSYFHTRLVEPWKTMLLFAGVGTFFIPFFSLIPKASKWTPAVTIPICVVVLCSQWLVYLLVVMPEVVPASKWGFPWIELGVMLGFLSLFLLAFLRAGQKVPMLAISDPLLLKSMSHH